MESEWNYFKPALSARIRQTITERTNEHDINFYETCPADNNRGNCKCIYFVRTQNQSLLSRLFAYPNIESAVVWSSLNKKGLKNAVQ